MIKYVTGNFSNEPIFYVYLHRRKDNDLVFYVGKGKHKRAWSTKSRNNHWINTVNKYGYTVEILKSGLTEEESFNLEIETIALYGIDNLTNLTIGGNTTSGFKHSDATKKEQSKITQQRRVDNPEWARRCDERMQELISAQINDPEFHKKIADINRQNYNNLSEAEKEDFANKRIAWMSDGSKKKSAIDKFTLTCSTPEFKAKKRQAGITAWEKLSDVERQQRSEKSTLIWKNPEFKAKLIEMHSYKIVVNRRFVFSSIKEFSSIVGNSNSLYKTLIEANLRGHSFTVFKGFVVEYYDDNFHANLPKYSGEILREIPTKILPKNNAVVMDNDLVFTSFKAAAEYFGDEKTESTPEWISKCMKINLPAMGHTWRKATVNEVELEILKQLDAAYLNTFEFNTEGTDGY